MKISKIAEEFLKASGVTKFKVFDRDDVKDCESLQKLIEFGEHRPVIEIERQDESPLAITVEEKMAEAVLDAKQGPLDAGEVRRLAEAAGMKLEDGMESRVIGWWSSSAKVDRDGDIVIQNWRLDEFRKNPIVLYGHERASLPIGVSILTEVKERIGVGPSLYLAVLYAPKESFELADMVYRMASQGFLRMGSVGFRAKRVIFVENEEERKKLGLGRWGVIHDEPELWEFSMVPLPSNTDATVARMAKDAVKSGVVKSADVPALREMWLPQVKRDAPDEWELLDMALSAMWKSVTETEKTEKDEAKDDSTPDDQTGDPAVNEIESRLAELKTIAEAIAEVVKQSHDEVIKRHDESLEILRETHLIMVSMKTATDGEVPPDEAIEDRSVEVNEALKSLLSVVPA